MNKKIRRGDIYLANLDPVVGSEQGGTRPVLVIQNNKGNKNSRTTIIAPITTQREYNGLPVHVYILKNIHGVERNSCVLLEQIRVTDTERFKKKLGWLDYFSMREIDRAIRVSVGLNKEYN